MSTALLDTGRRHGEGGSDGGADFVVDSLARLPHQLWQHFEMRSAFLDAYPKVRRIQLTSSPAFQGVTPPRPEAVSAMCTCGRPHCVTVRLSVWWHSGQDPAISFTESLRGSTTPSRITDGYMAIRRDHGTFRKLRTCPPRGGEGLAA